MARVCLILSLLFLLLGPGLAYFEVVPALWGFGLFALAGLLGLLASLASLVALLRKRGGSPAILVLGLLPLATVLAPALMVEEHPASTTSPPTSAIRPRSPAAATIQPSSRRWRARATPSSARCACSGRRARSSTPRPRWRRRRKAGGWALSIARR